MDRRYNQARFYNGTPATARSSNRSDSLCAVTCRARKETLKSEEGQVGVRYRRKRTGRSRTVLKSHRNKVFKEKALESMVLVESSMSRGSFLILGLDVWRNVSLNEMRRNGSKF